MPIHLIFEGAELSGKSYLMSLVYNKLEEKNATSKDILDGCHWINSDVGIFGTRYGRAVVEKYLEIARILKEKNLLFEKFHITDSVYQKFYQDKKVDYSETENQLKILGFKVVFVTFREDEKLLEKRLQERLNLYPHYRRIAKSAAFYLKQQKLYREFVKKSTLPFIEIDMSDLKDPTEEIIRWAQISQ